MRRFFFDGLSASRRVSRGQGQFVTPSTAAGDAQRRHGGSARDAGAGAGAEIRSDPAHQPPARGDDCRGRGARRGSPAVSRAG